MTDMKASYITPAVTLFHEDGTLDLESQGALYDYLIRSGIDGILVQGSIGEFFAMPMYQRMQLAKYAVEAIARRVPCIIGVTSMIVDEIAPFANCCLDFGADAVAILPPYYFPFDDESLFRYFHRLLEEIHGPVYLYNCPARTGCSISAETVLRLADLHSNLRGIKDTFTGMEHTRELIHAIKPRFPDFEIYSGFDDNGARNVLSGGDGVIGGLSNIVPEVCAAWMKAIREGDAAGIAAGQRRIDRLMDVYSVGSVFIPIIKEGARLRGIVGSNVCTFPMTPPTAAESEAIVSILVKEGVKLASTPVPPAR